MTFPTQITTARSRGFTMAELVVVLLIVAATAGIAGLLLLGTSTKAQQDTVKVSFLRIQAAIYGAEGRPGYYQDLGYPPQRMSDLLRPNGMDPTYDPSTRKGWNGPLLGEQRRDPSLRNA